MLGGLPSTLKYHGQSLCLKHLQPFTHAYLGHGVGGADLIVRVTIGSHVFSTSSQAQVCDFRDANGLKRNVCPGRYSASMSLASDIGQVLTHNCLTWEEQDKNQVANLAVLTPAGTQLISGQYMTIIYYLYPSQVPGIDVEFSVKSYYLKTLNFAKRRKRDKIRSCVKKCAFTNARIPKSK